METPGSPLHQTEGLLAEYSPLISESTDEKPINCGTLLTTRVQVRGSHVEGFQDLDVHGEGDDINQGPISDIVVSQAEPDDTDAVPAVSPDSEPPPTEEQQEQEETTATSAFRKENIAVGELGALKGDEVDGRSK